MIMFVVTVWLSLVMEELIMTNVYQELKKKALPFIEAYHDDLIKHDRTQLDALPDVPFLHFTGSTGTHIVMMPGIDIDYYPARKEQVPYL